MRATRGKAFLGGEDIGFRIDSSFLGRASEILMFQKNQVNVSEEKFRSKHVNVANIACNVKESMTQSRGLQMAVVPTCPTVIVERATRQCKLIQYLNLS